MLVVPNMMHVFLGAMPKVCIQFLIIVVRCRCNMKHPYVTYGIHMMYMQHMPVGAVFLSAVTPAA